MREDVNVLKHKKLDIVVQQVACTVPEDLVETIVLFDGTGTLGKRAVVNVIDFEPVNWATICLLLKEHQQPHDVVVDGEKTLHIRKRVEVVKHIDCIIDVRDLDRTLRKYREICPAGSADDIYETIADNRNSDFIEGIGRKGEDFDVLVWQEENSDLDISNGTTI